MDGALDEGHRHVYQGAAVTCQLHTFAFLLTYNHLLYMTPGRIDTFADVNQGEDSETYASAKRRIAVLKQQLEKLKNHKRRHQSYVKDFFMIGLATPM